MASTSTQPDKYNKNNLSHLLERPGFLVPGDFEPAAEIYDFMKSASRILVVGAGGLGCELLKDLALTGFGNIDVIDMDTIDVSNLNRQFLYVAAAGVRRVITHTHVCTHFRRHHSSFRSRRFVPWQVPSRRRRQGQGHRGGAARHGARGGRCGDGTHVHDPGEARRILQAVPRDCSRPRLARGQAIHEHGGACRLCETGERGWASPQPRPRRSPHENARRSRLTYDLHRHRSTATSNDEQACSFLEYDEEGKPLVETIKPLVDGGTEGFKGHARVLLPGVTPCFDCTLWMFPPQTKYPLCTLAETPRSAPHCIEYAKIALWPAAFPEVEFDGDNPQVLVWKE